MHEQSMNHFLLNIQKSIPDDSYIATSLDEQTLEAIFISACYTSCDMYMQKINQFNYLYYTT